MLVQGVIDVVVLVEREAGAGTRLVSPGVNSITDKVNYRLIRLVGLSIPQDRKGPPWYWIARPPSLDLSLRRLFELNRGESP
jgi:hypothetical protein